MLELQPMGRIGLFPGRLKEGRRSQFLCEPPIRSKEEEVKRKFLVVSASLAVALALILTTALSVGVRVASAKQARAQTAAAMAPGPADPFAKADKKYKGQSITYYGGSVGTDHDADVALAKSFQKSTGIKINITALPATSDATLAQLQRVFTAGSSSIDVTRLDVVWPGTFGKYLVDLKHLSGGVQGLEFKSLITNDTVGGHL